jgi:hypothetical protein
MGQVYINQLWTSKKLFTIHSQSDRFNTQALFCCGLNLGSNFDGDGPYPELMRSENRKILISFGITIETQTPLSLLFEETLSIKPLPFHMSLPSSAYFQ